MLILSLALCCVCVSPCCSCFPPSRNKPNDSHWCFNFPAHPPKKRFSFSFQRISEGNFFTAVSRSDTFLTEGEIPMVLKIKIHWVTDDCGWMVFNRRHSVRTQHTASTALVLWNYNIALEPKCMLLEATPLLCTGGFGIVFYLLEDREWFYCVKIKQKKKHGKCILCVIVHVCLCIIFVAALWHTHTSFVGIFPQ